MERCFETNFLTWPTRVKSTVKNINSPELNRTRTVISTCPLIQNGLGFSATPNMRLKAPEGV